MRVFLLTLLLAASAANAQSPAVAAKCRQALRDVPPWKDRGSVLVGAFTDMGRLTHEGRPVVAYATKVNGKNSFGGYEGEITAMCLVTEAGDVARVQIPSMGLY